MNFFRNFFVLTITTIMVNFSFAQDCDNQWAGNIAVNDAGGTGTIFMDLESYPREGLGMSNLSASIVFGDDGITYDGNSYALNLKSEFNGNNALWWGSFPSSDSDFSGSFGENYFKITISSDSCPDHNIYSWFSC